MEWYLCVFANQPPTSDDWTDWVPQPLMGLPVLIKTENTNPNWF